MAYKVIILYQLYMPSYFLGTFTEYPSDRFLQGKPVTKNGALHFSGQCLEDLYRFTSFSDIVHP